MTIKYVIHSVILGIKNITCLNHNLKGSKCEGSSIIIVDVWYSMGRGEGNLVE